MKASIRKTEIWLLNWYESDTFNYWINKDERLVEFNGWLDICIVFQYDETRFQNNNVDITEPVKCFFGIWAENAGNRNQITAA